MTNEQVNALVAPKAESVAAVHAFLKSHGVDITRDVEATPNNDMLTVHTTVAVAEAMLGSEYHHYEHSDMDGLRIMRLSSAYTLPADVAAEVDFVGPSVRYPTPLNPTAKRSNDDIFHHDDSSSGVNPTFLRKLYNVGDVQGKASGNIQSCAQFLGQYYAPSDLSTFFSKVYTPEKGHTPTVIGPNDEGNPGIEASLDIEYVSCASFPCWLLCSRQRGS